MYGGISLSIALLIMVSAGIAPADVQLGILRDFVPNNAEIASEVAAYRGAWADVQHVRLIEALDMQFSAIPLFLFWRARGLMLIGMALFKLGVFNAARSPKFYLRLVGVTGVIGFSLIGYGAVQLIDQNWDGCTLSLLRGKTKTKVPTFLSIKISAAKTLSFASE